MRKLPASINAQFNALLNTNNIPKRYQNHYLKWLRHYLGFCHNYGFSESNPQSLPKFIRKLKESGYPVYLYLTTAFAAWLVTQDRKRPLKPGDFPFRTALYYRIALEYG